MGAKDVASPSRFSSTNTTTSRLHYCTESATWGYITPRCTVMEAKKKKAGNTRGAVLIALVIDTPHHSLHFRQACQAFRFCTAVFRCR